LGYIYPVSSNNFGQLLWYSLYRIVRKFAGSLPTYGARTAPLKIFGFF
jgi:hypothetical protein